MLILDGVGAWNCSDFSSEVLIRLFQLGPLCVTVALEIVTFHIKGEER